MSRWERILFGQASFDESEEYLAFRFKLLNVLLLSGAICTLLFILGVRTQVNPFSELHLFSMCAFTACALVLWVALRGRKQRFLIVAWAYEVACLFEYTSALIFVSTDEMRVLWFATNISGVYIMLGQRAGFWITVIILAGLILGNPHLDAPYSQNALATTVLGLTYIAVFFHIYGSRSMSYFSRMRESNRQLQHMATHDPLTGVLNARAYSAACDRMILLAQRQKSFYAVLFVDLDHFKSINDTYGHDAGDQVLRTVAQALVGSVRQSDVVGRVGGEEFSVFLPDTGQDGAIVLAENLRRAIELLKPKSGGIDLKITASIGVAQSGGGIQTLQEVQKLADQAMYMAKQQGRNRVSTLSPPVRALLHE